MHERGYDRENIIGETSIPTVEYFVNDT